MHVKWLLHRVAGFLLWMPKLSSKVVHLGLVALKQFFLQKLNCPLRYCSNTAARVSVNKGPREAKGHKSETCLCSI